MPLDALGKTGDTIDPNDTEGIVLEMAAPPQKRICALGSGRRNNFSKNISQCSYEVNCDKAGKKDFVRCDRDERGVAMTTRGRTPKSFVLYVPNFYVAEVSNVFSTCRFGR